MIADLIQNHLSTRTSKKLREYRRLFTWLVLQMLLLLHIRHNKLVGQAGLYSSAKDRTTDKNLLSVRVVIPFPFVYTGAYN